MISKFQSQSQQCCTTAQQPRRKDTHYEANDLFALKQTPHHTREFVEDTVKPKADGRLMKQSVHVFGICIVRTNWILVQYPVVECNTVDNSPHFGNGKMDEPSTAYLLFILSVFGWLRAGWLVLGLEA